MGPYPRGDDSGKETKNLPVVRATRLRKPLAISSKALARKHHRPEPVPRPSFGPFRASTDLVKRSFSRPVVRSQLGPAGRASIVIAPCDREVRRVASRPRTSLPGCSGTLILIAVEWLRDNGRSYNADDTIDFAIALP